MESVKRILRSYGYETVEDMEPGDSVTVEVPSFMDLVIEKIAENRLSVAHYYTQMGDLMSDPEIVFQINGEEWVPIRYTQHPHIHQHDENGLPRVKNYVRKWDKNLRRRGYVDEAKKQGEVVEQ